MQQYKSANSLVKVNKKSAPETEHAPETELQTKARLALSQHDLQTHMPFKTKVAEHPDGSVTIEVQLFGNVAHIENLTKGGPVAVDLFRNGEQLDVRFTLVPAELTAYPEWDGVENRTGYERRKLAAQGKLGKVQPESRPTRRADLAF